jgi:hypothetical protein
VNQVETLDAARSERWDLLVVDVFPRGVVAELGPILASGPAWLIARRVNPAYYLHPPVAAEIESRFERVLWCEEPPPELSGLRVPQGRVGPVLLDPRPLSRSLARAELGLPPDDRVILALGSGPLETQRLVRRMIGKVAFRLRASFRFISDTLEGAEPRFPAARYFPAADAIVSAGGYHAFHEIAASGVPAVFLPQERPLDDQPWRVRGWPVAHDPVGLEESLRALLGGAGPRPRAGFEDGALQVARLIERRVKEGVLPEEQVAAVA